MFDPSHAPQNLKNELRKVDWDGVDRVLDSQLQWHDRDRPKKFRNSLERVESFRASKWDFSGDTIQIGKREDLSFEELELLEKSLRTFKPWRKGPWNFFGQEVDAEWRSFRKWNRLEPFLPRLKDRAVLDVGCNNGYYLYRIADHRPRVVLGIDPVLQFYYNFQMTKQWVDVPEVFYLPLGVEELPLFKQSFDVVFLMGILYHHPSPIEILRNVNRCLKPGGALVVETQAIPGEEPVALFPEARYAKVPGTYFVPTTACLKNWLIRAGFGDAEIVDSHPMSSEEQRQTQWMEFETYENFLDPNDSAFTVEGYPAPIRAYSVATKTRPVD